MIDEVAYYNYWKDRREGEKKANELLSTVRECQKEFGWPNFADDSKLLSYARVKGLLSSDERYTIKKYLDI